MSREQAGRPDRGDGRNVDPTLGILSGEAGGQGTPDARARAEGSAPFDVWTMPPTGDVSPRDDPTYYDRPALSEPTWIWTVPAYFHAGGAAGAAALLGAAAQLIDRPGLGGLVRRSRWVAAAGAAVGTVFLVVDLGRPERFLNMLRVFRPSSPMSVGSWVLVSFAPLAAGSALLAEAEGVLGLAGDVAALGAGALGMPLAGYTAVLLAGTAIPVWQATLTSSPPAFVGSAMAAGAAVLQLLGLSDREAAVARRFAATGLAAELAAHAVMDRQAGRVDEVARPMHEGVGGDLLKASKAMGAAALLLNLLPGRSRWRPVAAALLATGSSLALKFGLVEAGKASSRSPRATFHQQRAGFGGAEATGRRAVTGPEPA